MKLCAQTPFSAALNVIRFLGGVILEFVIDLRRVTRRIIGNMRLVIIVTLIFAAIGVSLTWKQAPNIFTSKVTLVGIANDMYSNVITTSQIMRNYAGMVQSEKIAESVVRQLPDYKLDTVSVQAMLNTSFELTTDSALFYITADSNDPDISIAVANTAAETFISELKSITGAEIATIVDKASTSVISYNGTIGQLLTRLEIAAVGFAAICVVLSFVEIFSKKVTEGIDCTLGGSIELLGLIPKHHIH